MMVMGCLMVQFDLKSHYTMNCFNRVQYPHLAMVFSSELILHLVRGFSIAMSTARGHQWIHIHMLYPCYMRAILSHLYSLEGNICYGKNERNMKNLVINDQIKKHNHD